MSDINQIEFSEISKKDELKSIIESLLFVSGEPLALKDICWIVEEDFNYVEDLMRELMNIYNGDSSRGIKIISLNGTYQLVTKTYEIRGVKSESAIQRLVEKNLVEETGRLEVPGRPILYGTTDEFLRHFALNDLGDLPSIELFEENDEVSDMVEE